MENNETINLLKRIAVALESIANSLCEKKNTTISDNSINASENIIEHTPHDKEVVDTDASSKLPLVIENFLLKRNITIKTLPSENLADATINSLSDLLGKNYNGFRELLSKIKQNMQHGTPFQLSIKSYSQVDMSNICQFSQKLYDIAFLKEYRYQKSPVCMIRATPTTIPVAQNFFSGKWLERFVLLTIQRVIQTVSTKLQKKLTFSYVINPQVILPNGDNFEIDILFQVHNSFYWIEAKSGDYQQHIHKYAKMSKILNLDCAHSIMVLTDISEDKTSALTALFSMTVLSISQLENKLLTVLTQDHNTNDL